MSPSRILAVMRKERLHIVRDPRTFFLVTLSPAFLLLTLTYFMSFDVQQVLLAVFDHDRSLASRRYVASLGSHQNVHLSGYVSSQDELDGWLLSGRVRGVVVIPPGFERALGRRQVSTVQLVLDGTDPRVASEAVARVEASTRSFLVQAGLMPHDDPRETLDLRTRVWYNSGLRSWFSFSPTCSPSSITWSSCVTSWSRELRCTTYGSRSWLWRCWVWPVWL